MARKRVGVLGATGMVGQRLIGLLRDHREFELTLLAASTENRGKNYEDACRQLVDPKATRHVHGRTLHDVLDVWGNASHVDLVFSSLPSEIAGGLEQEYAKRVPVISKASSHRLDPDVPLMIPELNPDHLRIIDYQRERRKTKGFISTDPNCSTVQLAITLKPLMELGSIETVVVSTAQALSGMGLPGSQQLNIENNIIPYIKGEEEKLVAETPKILGQLSLDGGVIVSNSLNIVASCKRVNVPNGHLEDVFVQFGRNVSLGDVTDAFMSFAGSEDAKGLRSAPKYPIMVAEDLDRPQPKLDAGRYGGMSVLVGRVRKSGRWISYTCLADNTIRGAAGNALLHAELLLRKGLI